MESTPRRPTDTQGAIYILLILQIVTQRLLTISDFRGSLNMLTINIE